MNLDMHTVLLDTNNRKLMDLRLQKLRGQSEKNDQMKTAGEITGSVPETSLDWRIDLERARRTLGMTFRRSSTEDRVLIASPDWSKWGTGHAEETTEEIGEAGISAIAFDCGRGRDRWRTFRMCL